MCWFSSSLLLVVVFFYKDFMVPAHLLVGCHVVKEELRVCQESWQPGVRLPLLELVILLPVQIPKNCSSGCNLLPASSFPRGPQVLVHGWDVCARVCVCCSWSMGVLQIQHFGKESRLCVGRQMYSAFMVGMDMIQRQNRSMCFSSSLSKWLGHPPRCKARGLLVQGFPFTFIKTENMPKQ